MKFKIGDKVRITDRTKVCSCDSCRNIMHNKYNDIYTVRSIRTHTIDLNIKNKGGNYVWVRSSGLELAAIPGQQLEFNFMKDK